MNPEKKCPNFNGGRTLSLRNCVAKIARIDGNQAGAEKRKLNYSKKLICISIFSSLTLILLIGQFPTTAYSESSAKLTPERERAGASIAVWPQITIPENLGVIDESFKGTSGKTIIYIQDAHGGF